MKNLLSRLLIALGIMMLLSACIGAGTIYADLSPVADCIDEAGNPINCGTQTTVVERSECVESDGCKGARSAPTDRCRKEGTPATAVGDCFYCDGDVGTKLCQDSLNITKKCYVSKRGPNTVVCGFFQKANCRLKVNAPLGAECVWDNTTDPDALKCELRTCSSTDPNGSTVSSE